MYKPSLGARPGGFDRAVWLGPDWGLRWPRLTVGAALCCEDLGSPLPVFDHAGQRGAQTFRQLPVVTEVITPFTAGGDRSAAWDLGRRKTPAPPLFQVTYFVVVSIIDF